MGGKKKSRGPPANATAWCELHQRMMNDVYIRRRGCVMRMCKHLRWLCMMDQPDKTGTESEPCEDAEPAEKPE